MGGALCTVGPVLGPASYVGPVLSDRPARSKGKGQRSKVRYQGLGTGINPDVGVRVTRMRKSVGVVLLACGAVAWSGSMMLAQDDARHVNRSMPAGSTLSMVIDKFCAGCHNDALRSASELLLEKFDVARIGASPELWAKAYRQMQAGAMLPVGSPRPDRATNDAALVEIERMMGADTKPTAAKSQEVATRHRCCGTAHPMPSCCATRPAIS